MSDDTAAVQSRIDVCLLKLEKISILLKTGQNIESINEALSDLIDCEEDVSLIEDDADEVLEHHVSNLKSIVASLHERVIVTTKSIAEMKKQEGNSEFKKGYFEAALLKYQEAIDIDDSDPHYYSNSALTMQRLDRWEDALKQAETAIQLDPNFTKAYVIMIKSYLKLGHLKFAHQALLLIDQLDDSSKDVLDLKLQTSAGAKDQGNKYFKEGNFDDALEYYKLAIDLDPDNYILYSNRSACYQSKRMWQEAIGDARTVIDLNGAFAKGYIHLARSQIQLKLLEDAKSTIQSAYTQLESSPGWSTLRSQFDDLSREISTKITSSQNSVQDKVKAETFKTKGNQLYQQGSYQDAIRSYSQAIAVCPSEGLYYGNRAACWIMLKEFTRAIGDCDLGLSHEVIVGTFDKLRLRKVTALTSMGKLDEAIALVNDEINKSKDESYVASPSAIAPFNEQLKSLQLAKNNIELAEKSLENKEFSRAKRLLQQIQASGVSDDVRLTLLLARAHLNLGELEEASRISQTTMSTSANRGGGNCLDAYLIRGEALAGMGLTEQASKHYTAALQLDPDNQVTVQKLKQLRKVISEVAAVRTAHDAAVAAHDYETAIQKCSEGLIIDRNNKKILSEMHYKRAKAYQSLAKVQAKTIVSPQGVEHPSVSSYRRSLQDSSSALYYDKSMLPAIYLKVEILQSLGRHEEAVQEMEYCVKEGPGKDEEEAAEKLKTAKRLLKNSKRKDMYAVLGLDRNDVTVEEIKKHYKKSALKWHPDRHSSSTEEVKKDAEAKFKDINAAFELLTDPVRRPLWDQGYDLDEIEQKIEMDKQRQQQQHGGFRHFH